MAGEKIVQIMQKAATPKVNTQSDLIYGEVTSTSPLLIKIDNRLTISEPFIIVSALCKSKSITISHYTNTETIVLWGDLEVGDVVRMIRLGNGQKYYVIEKEGGLIE